jgi:hypothetical protein
MQRESAREFFGKGVIVIVRRARGKASRSDLRQLQARTLAIERKEETQKSVNLLCRAATLYSFIERPPSTSRTEDHAPHEETFGKRKVIEKRQSDAACKPERTRRIREYFHQ